MYVVFFRCKARHQHPMRSLPCSCSPHPSPSPSVSFPSRCSPHAAASSRTVCRLFPPLTRGRYWTPMSHSLLQSGHTCSLSFACSHVTMQCMWNACLHTPRTGGQSSPGTLQVGQHDSNGRRQMPHTSSGSATFHLHVATKRAAAKGRGRSEPAV